MPSLQKERNLAMQVIIQLAEEVWKLVLTRSRKRVLPHKLADVCKLKAKGMFHGTINESLKKHPHPHAHKYHTWGTFILHLPLLCWTPIMFVEFVTLRFQIFLPQLGDSLDYPLFLYSITCCMAMWYGHQIEIKLDLSPDEAIKSSSKFTWRQKKHLLCIMR